VLRSCEVLSDFHEADAVTVGEVVQKFKLFDFLLVGLVVVAELLYSLPGHVLTVECGCVLRSGLVTFLVDHYLGKGILLLVLLV